MSEILPAATASRLGECERGIERGLDAVRAGFVEVGQNLAVVRDSRLYRAEYGTFEEYAEKRWGLSRPRAYQFIESAAVNRSLSTVVDKDRPLPVNEAQTRELAPLLGDPDELRETWDEANRRTGGKPTAAAIRDVRQERQAPPPSPVKPPKPEPSRQKRRPITDAAAEAGWALRKDVERIGRIVADDRFGANRDRLTAQLESQLAYAAEEIARLRAAFAEGDADGN